LQANEARATSRHAGTRVRGLEPAPRPGSLRPADGTGAPDRSAGRGGPLEPGNRSAAVSLAPHGRHTPVPGSSPKLGMTARRELSSALTACRATGRMTSAPSADGRTPEAAANPGATYEECCLTRGADPRLAAVTRLDRRGSRRAADPQAAHRRRPGLGATRPRPRRALSRRQARRSGRVAPTRPPRPQPVRAGPPHSEPGSQEGRAPVQRLGEQRDAADAGHAGVPELSSRDARLAAAAACGIAELLLDGQY
jgi:hypothetical protein